MKIIITDTYEEMSKKAADLFAEQISRKKDSIIGLATGSTPEGMYDELVKMYEAGQIDFAEIISFNLDEYCGLDGNNPQSYKYFMEEHLLGRVNIKKENTNIPLGITDSPEEISREYDSKIESMGGIDIQVLGIGVNGHIGFNEPGDNFVAETHKVKLSKETIEANSRFFEDPSQVPTEAITMGMKSIMGAKKVILIANGPKKADAIFKTVRGPITPEVPASILQLHPDLIVIIDKEAANSL